MATKRDEDRVTIRVMGRYFMNSPMIPGQKTMGKKAASVVRVEPITGQATSPVAFMAASTRGMPCCMYRYIFSIITMALSTSIPRARVKENKTTIFKIDNPNKDLVKNDEGVLEPDPKKCKALLLDQIDIAIVPGLAFDEKGGRIGIVDNFYDKFIAKLPVTTRKVALAFEEQVVTVVHADSRNKHIDIIITDKRTIYKI